MSEFLAKLGNILSKAGILPDILIVGGGVYLAVLLIFLIFYFFKLIFSLFLKL
jgi:hypothetical protein